MKAKRMPILEPDYFTLESLAEAYECHVDDLRALADCGKLEAVERFVLGEARWVVMAAARAEFEARTDRGPEKIHKRRENNLLRQIGVLAIAYAGGDLSMLEQPGSIWADAERTAAIHGASIANEPSSQTAAAAMRDGIELLKAEGGYNPKRETKTLTQNDQPNVRAA